jgi:phosphoribosylglycinamide formyltransferase-1
MPKPKLIIFASGTVTGGGSGFENLVHAMRDGVLDAEIVAVVSNHAHGGVREKAERLGVPFIYFDGTKSYLEIVTDAGAQWVALSGWLKQVEGLDPQKTFNIHPALFSQLGGRFGGHGMYKRKVHEAVKAVLDAGEINESGFTMHFVTDEVDRGPVFFEYRIPLHKKMSAEEIGKAVQAAEHEWQPKVTNMVVHGEIHWDGKDPATLVA